MMLLMLALLSVSPMFAMKAQDKPHASSNFSLIEYMKPMILAARQVDAPIDNLTIGYSTGKVTAGSAKFTQAYCAQICNGETMIGNGYNLVLFGISPYNPTWDAEVGKGLALMEVYSDSANRPVGSAGNVVNYKDAGRKTFLPKIVFDPLKYGLSSDQEICVAVSIVGISGVFSFQLRWVLDPVTDIANYGPVDPNMPKPKPADVLSMIQFADMTNGPNSFQVQNFQPYKVRAHFCQRPSSTGFKIRFRAVGAGLSAFNSFLCPAHYSDCDQLSEYVEGDTSGSSFNQMEAMSGTSLSDPDVQVWVYGFGGEPTGANSGSFTIEFLSS